MTILGALANALTSSMRVIGSTVVGKHGAVLVGVEGPAGGLDDFDEDAGGEERSDVEFFSSPGLVWRPRAKEVVDGDELEAEARGFRTSEGIVPIAWRDLRFHRAFPAPKPGTVALVGYGGGFIAFDDTEDLGQTLATNLTVYVPYDFVDGVPTKAHSLIIGRDANGKPVVDLSSGEGPGFTILDKETTWKNSAGDAFIVLNDEGIFFNGNVRANGAWDINGARIDATGDVTVPIGPTSVSLRTHMHPTAMGPSGVPIPSAP